MNKPRLSFNFSFRSDGSSTTVSVNLATGPISFDGGTTVGAAPFAVGATEAIDLIDGGETLTYSFDSISQGVLKINITGGSQVEGTSYGVSGVLLFG